MKNNVKFDIIFDGNSIEIYIGRLRIELWAAIIQSLSGVVVYVWPSLSLRGSPEYIGMISHLDWVVFQLGISLRWMRDGDIV